MVWPYILGSAFMRRTNLKPSGYAGDAELMKMLYENRYVGRYLFNQLLHKHPVETPAAQAVRNRRRRIPEVMREVLERFPRAGAHGFRLLSVACGPAWELQDLFLAAEDFERFHCTLLDQDTEALGLAREGIRRIEGMRGIRISADFLPESVRTMLRIRDLPARFGRHHFIYSMGLFDYLTTPVARAVLARLYELLLPGGTLLVGNYHVRNPTRTYMDYWMDWPLLYRTEESFLQLAADLPAAHRSISSDDTGCQMFLRLERP
jgi:extracellular factor (EF) 3-hydroxypalmitic acid methyl ester biosynthesis protein